MKILRGTFLFVFSIDKGIFRNNIAPNRYFASLSVLAIMLVGMYYNIDLENWAYDWSWDSDYTYGQMSREQLTVDGFITLALIWAFNVAEGIVACSRGWVPLARAGILAGIFFLVYLLANLLPPVVVLILVILWLVGLIVTEIIVAVKGNNGQSVDGSALFDFEQPAQQPRFCGHCGSPIAPGHQFCGECGARVKSY